jgi:hypothetical protein
MSWADRAKEELRAGREVTIRPRGGSMKGLIDSGDSVKIVPITDPPKVGQVVLVRVKSNDYLHLIKARDGDRVLIGNNRGGTNGWAGSSAVYGVAILANDRPLP